jgi:hypothetical protein
VDGCGMTSYAELNRQRKLARPLYLELRALGLDLRAREDQGEPTGYRVEVRGLASLSPAHADRVRRGVEELKPGLTRLLMMGRWDPDYSAVREEGEAA